MKKLFLLIFIVIVLQSCSSNSSYKSPEDKWYSSYDSYVEAKIAELHSPVILVAKAKSMGRYNIVIKDSTNTLYTFGNLSLFASTIGASRCVGDTIK